MRFSRKWKQKAREFKRDLGLEMNRPLAICIIKTYSAHRHRKHIYKVWEFLGFNYPEVYRAYCDKVQGSHITGRDDFFHSISFACPFIYRKYFTKLPEQIALGLALSVSLSYVQKVQKSNPQD